MLGIGVQHIGLVGLIIAVINIVAGSFRVSTGPMIFGALGSMIAGALAPIAIIVSFIATPLVMVIQWLIISGIFFIFASILHGKGDYVTQSYLIALYLAPLSLLASILGLIPFLGSALSALVFLYGLYPLTLAMKETHHFTTTKAVLSWLLPVIVLVVIGTVFAVTAILSLLSNFNA